MVNETQAQGAPQPSRDRDHINHMDCSVRTCQTVEDAFAALVEKEQLASQAVSDAEVEAATDDMQKNWALRGLLPPYKDDRKSYILSRSQYRQIIKTALEAAAAVRSREAKP